MKVILLIRAFQRNGYLRADIDPLGFDPMQESANTYKLYQHLYTLDYKSYGFTEADLDKEFVVYTEQINGILSNKEPQKLRDILNKLERAYCSTIGVEYMHITSREECNFMREVFEKQWINYKPTKDEHLQVFDRLAWAVLFEEFLQNKFTTTKRFGLEGLEALISGFKSFIDRAVLEHGVKDITLGMAHRGRINVLANVFRKPIPKILSEFQGKFSKRDDESILIGSGDVKYHLGTFYERTYPNGKTIHMDILPNPSHLEAVNPVVQGKVRAKQHFNNDVTREQHLAVLVHGDAAFAGQGVVYESMQMSELENYKTGGVLHIIANNQIGFTTTPKDSRSTPFPTDLGKAYDAPIIHVNADDPVAVEFAFKVAADFSKKFPKDIIIDVIGYRKQGHNELDQPLFTQPLMYTKIAAKENVLQIYKNKLIQQKIATEEELNNMTDKIKQLLETYYQDASSNKFEKQDWVPKQWENFSVQKYSAVQNTGVDLKHLISLADKINKIPDEFTPHPQIQKIYENRIKSIRDGKGLDWATAEALAWATLLEEGRTVRISGQDVERGTFSHRHAVIHNQKDGSKYVPLRSIARNPNNFQACNSHLSEYAVLGFELGFSYYNPESLVLWEAQFGDFANGAQIILDQFITSGESKWNVPTGLVLLLPHGMDGQGPEHSSCRIERFLQAMDDDCRDIPDIKDDKVFQIQKTNMQVCNPSFSSNYFHVLLRQLKRQFRKPLIIPSPKKLLRLKAATSSLEEFAEGTRFIKLRPETNENVTKKADKVRKILVCSGQVYYDLITRREKTKAEVN